jgi:hypothetical protein
MLRRKMQLELVASFKKQGDCRQWEMAQEAELARVSVDHIGVRIIP